MHRRTLLRELAARPDAQAIRLAVIGGSTTSQLVPLLELLLLHSGFRATFYQGEYGRFYEDAVHDPQALIDFKPDLVYLHTSCYDAKNLPPVHCTEADLAGYLDAEMLRWRTLWTALEERLGCQIIQNNFERPALSTLGNMDAWAGGSVPRYLTELNLLFAREAATRRSLLLQDASGLAADLGTRHWFDWERYYSYKVLLTPEAQLQVARSLTAMVRAIYGRSRKVLVLDLDNTLWGGVVGDDGVDKLQIGRETPEAEAFTAFQEYCLRLRDRGVLLAVCSKNEDATAKAGLLHPDSILRIEDFAAFKANWFPKHENLQAIARDLNLGLDSLVFVDDNPAERALVHAQLPQVAVPEVGNDPARYAEILQAGRYFEPASLVAEDFERSAQYATRTKREAQAAQFADYGEYLRSLEMHAEIAPFQPVYLDRIAQLTNKTNQFNLTTRRYTLAEIEAAAHDPSRVTLYGKLSDRFGDHGLITVVLGHREGTCLHLDLWLMSCRVLKRDMEKAMLDALVQQAAAMGLDSILGLYLPTAKNTMVAQHYPALGFKPAQLRPGQPPAATAWLLRVAGYQPQNLYITL